VELIIDVVLESHIAPVVGFNTLKVSSRPHALDLERNLNCSIVSGSTDLGYINFHIILDFLY